MLGALLIPIALTAAASADPRLAAAQSLGRPVETIHLTAASWNGRPTRFVDYIEGQEGEEERQLVALVANPDGTDRRVAVTTGEQEGGVPEVAAIGFANADRDPASELIVILSWHIRHYDVEGTLYDIRILDDLKSGQTALTPLDRTKLFESYACDCNRRDAPPERARIKTIATVKRALKRAGY